jgi:hypothetical protein
LRFTFNIEEFSNNEDEWKVEWRFKGPHLEPLPPQGFSKDRKEQSGREDSIVHDGN